jgi:hypothetical protein
MEIIKQSASGDSSMTLNGPADSCMSAKLAAMPFAFVTRANRSCSIQPVNHNHGFGFARGFPFG